MSQLTELQLQLKNIFQINRADLDFGIYRILNSKSQEITHYIEQTLPKTVRAAFTENTHNQLTQLQHELEQAIKQASDLGVHPDNTTKVKDLKAQIAQMTSASHDDESEIYNHLTTFFSRYYEEGDFISQRRYKGDTYAIPYAGEEVVLHWANKDQYYTKSGENFSNYRFKLADGKEVFFKLVHADTAKDNRKDNNNKRVFVLAQPQLAKLDDNTGEEIRPAIEPISQSQDGNTLIICFEYQLVEQKAKQETYNQKACEQILAHDLVQTAFAHLIDKNGTEKNPNRTILEKHLADYTHKNTADYFIHKDLRSFLRRELDFYIKNEVMNLDNITSSDSLSGSLKRITTLRAIAHDIIDFLAQLENFQKRLWEKKKLVTHVHYLITLDKVPFEFHADIFANEKQTQKWQNLFVINELPPPAICH